MIRLWWSLIAAWAACAGWTLWMDRGPQPLAHPTADRLAAQHIVETVRVIAGDGIPRPAGSEHNALIRERLAARIESLGLPVVQHETSHHRFRNTLFGEVALCNLMFRVTGTASPGKHPCLMLSAHYDSSTQGPGAADDASGVAILLEIAERLQREPPRCDVVFLITDGEEYGLLGAQRWVEEHPWAGEIGMVINVEARGSGGPSLMFQTSEPNGRLVEHFARHVQRPRTSSLFAEVYRILPNDTDLTVFLRAGMKGYNFAFIGNVRNYHTPDDTVENLSLTSLQHQADNVWQLTRSLCETDWQSLDSGAAPAVYFDLFSSMVIRWPVAWSIPMTLTALVLWCAAAIVPNRVGLALDGGNRFLKVLIGVAGVVAAWAIVTAGLWLLVWALRWDARLSHPWPVVPLPLIASLWIAAVALVVGVVELTQRWFSANQWQIALGWLWAAMGIAVAWLLVGGSYLWIIPLLVGSFVLAVIPARWSSKPAIIAASFGLSAGLMWLPMEGLFYDALGMRMPVLSAARWAYIALTLAPMAGLLTPFHRRRVLIILFASWFVLTVIAIAVQPSATA